VLIPILVMTPKNSAEEVFSHWENNSGWGSMGTAFMLSQITILYCSLGSDSVVHISEEVEDASVTVPRCMVWSFLGNIFAGFVMLIAMLFCIGPLDAVLEVDVPYALLFNNTGSRPLSLFLNLLLLVLIYAGNITSLATSAREMWAFSRDNGLPFSPWLSKMYVQRLSIYSKQANESQQEPQVEHSLQLCLRHICHRCHPQFDPAWQLACFRDSRLFVSAGSLEHIHD
jgi:choline transport protein